MEKHDETVVIVNQRRSERIAMEVAVIITLTSAEGETLQDEAYSRVVNAHGGLLTSHFELHPDERITVPIPSWDCRGRGGWCDARRRPGRNFRWPLSFRRLARSFGRGMSHAQRRSINSFRSSGSFRPQNTSTQAGFHFGGST